MAYRAEIEIAVRGARQLQELRNRIESTADSIDEINRGLVSVSQGSVASFSELSSALREAQQNFDNAARGTSAYGNALDDVLAAERTYNAELRERNRLLNNARAAQEASQKVITPGSTGFSSSQYGPAAPPSLIRGGQVQQSWGRFFGEAEEIARELQSTANTRQGVIKQSWGRFFNEAEEVARDLQNTANTRQGVIKQSWGRFFSEAEEVARELQNTAKTRQGVIKQSWNRFFSEAEEVAKELQNTAKTREGTIKKSWNRFFIEAAEVALDLQNTADARQGVIKQSWNRFFSQAAETAKDLQNTALQARARRRKEALGSGIIGGAFPLLFGQGIGAAVGGGAGGAAGGLIGGQFGFGLSLVGTALGSSFDALVEGAKELGAALDPLTADISAITKASGLSGSKLEKLILDLEKTGDAAGALSLATEELEKVVGQRGVEALKEFSQTTQDLSNDFEVFLTKFKAFMADVFNTLIVPRAEVELKKRGETIAAARESTDPTIQRAVSQLDSASTISERLRIQEVIVSLVEEEEAARRRELELQIASKGEAAAKLREVRASVAEKRIELEIEQLNADANDKTRVFLEKKLAFQRKLTQEQVLYNKYAREQIKIDILRLEIDKLRVGYEKELARIDNAAAAANEKAAKAAARKAKRPESKALSLQRDILRERLDLFNVDEQIARVGLDRLDILQREQSATMVRYLVETQILEAARKDALNKNKVKADEALINELYDARLLKIRKAAILALSESQAAQDRLRAEQQIADLRATAGFDPLALAERTQPYGMYGAPEQLMDFSTGAEINAIVKQEIALERVLEKYQQIGQAAQLTSELVTTGFQDMLTGTKSAEEVFANFLRNMAEILIKTAQQMIAQYIAIGIARAFALGQSPAVGTRASDFNLPGFGNLGPDAGSGISGFLAGGSGILGRAKGGPVSTGTPYMVGERGPELFVPRSSGTIIPNDKMMGGSSNVVVNVDASGTKVQGDNNEASQLGKAIGAAVQAELVKQKRPGGLLAGV